MTCSVLHDTIDTLFKDPGTTDPDALLLRRFQHQIITECADCEFCGGSITGKCWYLSSEVGPRCCAMHEKLNNIRQDIEDLTEVVDKVYTPQMELDVLSNHRKRLGMIKERIGRRTMEGK